MFVVFEGVNGCGKSTIAESVRNALSSSGRVWVSIEKEADYATELGMIGDDKPLPLAELGLRLAARVTFVERLKALLANNYIVIADRFTPSTIAYQCDLGGVPRSLVDHANALACDGLTPDLVIYLQAPHNRVYQYRRTPRAVYDTLVMSYDNQWQANPQTWHAIDTSALTTIETAYAAFKIVSDAIADTNAGKPITKT